MDPEDLMTLIWLFPFGIGSGLLEIPTDVAVQKMRHPQSRQMQVVLDQTWRRRTQVNWSSYNNSLLKINPKSHILQCYIHCNALLISVFTDLSCDYVSLIFVQQYPNNFSFDHRYAAQGGDRQHWEAYLAWTFYELITASQQRKQLSLILGIM